MYLAMRELVSLSATLILMELNKSSKKFRKLVSQLLGMWLT